MSKHFSIVVGLLSLCSAVHSTSDEQLLNYVKQFCSSQGVGHIITPTRVGKAGPRGQIGAKGEPGMVNYAVVNDTITHILEEKITILGSKLAETTAAQQRSEQCCSEVTQLKEGFETLRREVSSLFIQGGWRQASNGLLYYFVNSVKTKIAAAADCRRRGAVLPTSGIRNSTVLREIAGFADSDRFWIGLTDEAQEGLWKWEDGITARPGELDWRPGEPNNSGGVEDCALIYNIMEQLGANDVPCNSYTSKYLCEKTL